MEENRLKTVKIKQRFIFWIFLISGIILTSAAFAFLALAIKGENDNTASGIASGIFFLLSIALYLLSGLARIPHIIRYDDTHIARSWGKKEKFNVSWHNVKSIRARFMPGFRGPGTYLIELDLRDGQKQSLGETSSTKLRINMIFVDIVDIIKRNSYDIKITDQLGWIKRIRPDLCKMKTSETSRVKKTKKRASISSPLINKKRDGMKKPMFLNEEIVFHKDIDKDKTKPLKFLIVFLSLAFLLTMVVIFLLKGDWRIVGCLFYVPLVIGIAISFIFFMANITSSKLVLDKTGISTYSGKKRIVLLRWKNINSIESKRLTFPDSTGIVVKANYRPYQFGNINSLSEETTKNVFNEMCKAKYIYEDIEIMDNLKWLEE